MPPIRITRTALCLPPCRADKASADALRTKDSNAFICAQHSSAWELCTKHVLYADPGDDPALHELLQKRKAQLRNTYDQELRRIAKLPKRESAEERRLLKARYAFIRSRGVKELEVPVWQASLEDVKNGWDGILENYLHAWWAKENGFDIEVIKDDAQKFRRWMESVAVNARFNVYHSGTQTREIRHGLKRTEVEWLVSEAVVRYQIDFSDGTRAWLDNIIESDITDVQSLREFDELVKSHTPPEPPPWYSAGFAAIWRYNRCAERADELPLSNEFRALCQLLAARADQTSQFGEIESQIGTRTRELDRAAGQTDNASPLGKRRLRDMLRTKIGKILVAWNVLTVRTSGRERFIKLSPPKPVE